MMIVILFGQKLRSIEHGVTLIVTQFGLLFFRNIGPNLAYRHTYVAKFNLLQGEGGKEFDPFQLSGGCLRSRTCIQHEYP
jgi:hypothetical protein